MDPIMKLEAIEGIKLAKAGQQRGVDTKDGELLRRVFADDVIVDCRGVATDPVSGVNMSPATDVVIHGAEGAIAAAMDTLNGVVSVHT